MWMLRYCAITFVYRIVLYIFALSKLRESTKIFTVRYTNLNGIYKLKEKEKKNCLKNWILYTFSTHSLN